MNTVTSSVSVSLSEHRLLSCSLSLGFLIWTLDPPRSIINSVSCGLQPNMTYCLAAMLVCNADASKNHWGWFHRGLWLLFHSSPTFLNSAGRWLEMEDACPWHAQCVFPEPQMIRREERGCNLEIPLSNLLPFEVTNLKARGWGDLILILQQKGDCLGSGCTSPDLQWPAPPDTSTVPCQFTVLVIWSSPGGKEHTGRTCTLTDPLRSRIT